MNIDTLFTTYIFGWMCADIEREIQWARESKSAGNALCALGLLSYTEAMAYLLPSSRRPGNGSRQHFDAFFRELGPYYANLLDRGEFNVYDVFRCGLSHEYFVKQTCTIAMLNTTPGSIEVKGSRINEGLTEKHAPTYLLAKPVECALGCVPNGSYYFVVEKYYQDFRAACERLYHELKSLSHTPLLPVSYNAMSSTGDK
jgi:hypothetical protein